MGQCVTIAATEPYAPFATRETQSAFVKSDQIIRCFQYVADYLSRKGAEATLVAVGGVVDVLYLRIADQTDDIEFLGPAISHRTYLEVAMHGAIAHLGLPSRKIEQTNKLPVGENWQSLMEVLGRGPRETIFRQPGLQVVAAPWNYGFCVKMDMLRRGATGAITPTPRHVSDAAVYLDSVIKHQPPDRLPFTERELYRILTDYSVQVSELSVGHVLNTYRTLYKREPLAPRR